MAFVDEAKFFVKAGSGGNGCVSFRREKYVPLGGPDGGDGGSGGSVIIEASKRYSSLIDFRYRSHFLATNGIPGQGKKMHGRNGIDKIVQVPVGSIIKDAETGERLAELLNDAERFLAAKGGQGGAGNSRYASSNNRAPRVAGQGKPGEERWLKIELKILADVGLVGLPNAGKSTLLSKLSAACPKIAPYPFTTLEPQLGVLQLKYHDPCIIADIPGLIENAHQGAGLGIRFLRHIERTRLLLLVVDGSGPDTEPIANLRLLTNELQCYDSSLLSRSRLIVLNKIDLLPDRNRLEELRREFAGDGFDIFPISAATGEGIDSLKEKIVEIIENTVAI